MSISNNEESYYFAIYDEPPTEVDMDGTWAVTLSDEDSTYYKSFVLRDHYIFGADDFYHWVGYLHIRQETTPLDGKYLVKHRLSARIRSRLYREYESFDVGDNIFGMPERDFYFSFVGDYSAKTSAFVGKLWITDIAELDFEVHAKRIMPADKAAFHELLIDDWEYKHEENPIDFKMLY